ncbi:MAG: hypothetical protein GY760_28215 [Deltaproteobacteria bacterium]|nr:hypothetical protein [Deltaproteobacteria bacterium]
MAKPQNPNARIPSRRGNTLQSIKSCLNFSMDKTARPETVTSLNTPAEEAGNHFGIA